MPIAPSTYYDYINRQPSRRQVRDETLKAQIARVHAENYGVYGWPIRSLITFGLMPALSAPVA